jgi:uncharacterized protein YkuJ
MELEHIAVYQCAVVHNADKDMAYNFDENGGVWAMIKYATPQKFTGLKMMGRRNTDPNSPMLDQYIKSFKLEFNSNIEENSFFEGKIAYFKTWLDYSLLPSENQ